jgi:hypothetical protein
MVRARLRYRMARILLSFKTDVKNLKFRDKFSDKDIKTGNFFPVYFCIIRLGKIIKAT